MSNKIMDENQDFLGSGFYPKFSMSLQPFTMYSNFTLLVLLYWDWFNQFAAVPGLAWVFPFSRNNYLRFWYDSRKNSLDLCVFVEISIVHTHSVCVCWALLMQSCCQGKMTKIRKFPGSCWVFLYAKCNIKCCLYDVSAYHFIQHVNFPSSPRLDWLNMSFYCIISFCSYQNPSLLSTRVNAVCFCTCRFLICFLPEFQSLIGVLFEEAFSFDSFHCV